MSSRRPRTPAATRRTPEGHLRHEVPLPLLARLLFLATALFMAGITAAELGRFLWPFHTLTPLFTPIVAGAWFIAAVLVYTAILGEAMVWTVAPSRIEIMASSPLFRRRFHYRPADVAGFTVVMRDWTDSPTTWTVVLTTVGGVQHEASGFRDETAAEEFMAEVEALLSPDG